VQLRRTTTAQHASVQLPPPAGHAAAVADVPAGVSRCSTPAQRWWHGRMCSSIVHFLHPKRMPSTITATYTSGPLRQQARGRQESSAKGMTPACGGRLPPAGVVDRDSKHVHFSISAAVGSSTHRQAIAERCSSNAALRPDARLLTDVFADQSGCSLCPSPCPYC
jgi:hypothetical protein